MSALQTPHSPAAGQAGAEHTTREIAQQPALWRELADILDLAQARIDAFLLPWLARPGTRVIFTGAGSSGFIAEMAADAANAAWPAEARAIHTTSLLTHPQLYLQRERPTLLVSFGRSGSSPESVAAVDLVRAQVDEVRFLDITCNAEGELARRGAGRADTLALLMPPASCDRSFAMTSSLTCMLLAALTVFEPAPWPQRLQRLQALSRLAEQLDTDWSKPVAAVFAGDLPGQRPAGSGRARGRAEAAGVDRRPGDGPGQYPAGLPPRPQVPARW